MNIRNFSTCVLLLLCLIAIVAIDIHTAPTTQEWQGAPFRLGIVGLAHGHAWIHFRNLTKNNRIQVVGIADANSDLRALALKTWPNVPIYEDYRKMFDEKKPEGVWSFVENDRHLEITQACASRRISVMFEKPMATTYADARQMLAVAQKSKIQLLVNSEPPWWPGNYAAYNLAKSGQLGKIWRVHTMAGHGGPAPREGAGPNSHAFWSFLNDDKRGGGALLDFLCYGAVWTRWYLGMPRTIYAVTTHTRPDVYKVDTNATVLASFPDNGIAIIEGSWDLPHGVKQVEVYGNLGSIALFGNMGTVEKIEAFVERAKKPLPVPEVVLDEDHSSAPNYFAKVVRGGGAIDDLVSPAFNLDVQEILEAAMRSSKSGQPVNLPIK